MLKVIPIKQNSLEAELPEPNIINQITKDIISDLAKKEDELFVKALRTMAVPPIKGEITKGKLKWRGIRLVQGNYGIMGQMTRQLFQRKTPISPAVYFKGMNFTMQW